MDSDSLYYSLDLVCGNGLRLSAEQRAALQTSLVILKRNYKFNRVLFWGKIWGIENDYFIAKGVGEDELSERKYLYSFNCMDWHLLPPATEALVAEVAFAAKGHFLGDPSHKYEHIKVQYHLEGEQATEEQVTVKVTEESRLAVTVFTIDREVAVVPRGAYIKSPHGSLQTNRSFDGLNPSEASKLSSYLHFFEPQNPNEKSILEKAGLNTFIDIHNLSKDIPKGSWSLQFEQGTRVCVIRSLLWLGLTFFHMPMTSQHGYIYMGDGLKNLDLPFMM